MPGRLVVDYYDNLLKCSARGRLDEQRTGTRVSATGTLTSVRFVGERLERAHALLTDTDGNSALITFAADAVAVIRPILAEQAQITVYGLAVAAADGLPAGIAGYNARIAGTR
jgi:hypothetical protein